MEKNKPVILVVDDDVPIQILMQSLLREFGFHPVTAGSGEQALEVVRGGVRPDLVLLDMNMPRVDGFRVLRQMRRSETLKRIPVVVLCRSAEEALRAVAGEVRANDCIVKPLAEADLERLAQGYRNWTLRLDLPEEDHGSIACPGAVEAGRPIEAHRGWG